jgi:hypothetical protein
MEKAFVVKRVAEKLWATENAIDEAIGQTSILMADVVTARKEVKAGAGLTEPATTKIIQAMSALSEARAAMLEAHEALEEVKLRLGVRTKMWKPFPQLMAPPESEEQQRAS